MQEAEKSLTDENKILYFLANWKENSCVIPLGSLA